MTLPDGNLVGYAPFLMLLEHMARLQAFPLALPKGEPRLSKYLVVLAPAGANKNADPFRAEALYMSLLLYGCDRYSSRHTPCAWISAAAALPT